MGEIVIYDIDWKQMAWGQTGMDVLSQETGSLQRSSWDVHCQHIVV